MADWTKHAVEGKNISGVAVATRIRSISSGVTPPSFKALCAAFTARSEALSLSDAILLSDIPVRV